MIRYPDTIRKNISGDLRVLAQKTGYHIAKFNVPDVWLSTKGEGVTVAVLDTGCQIDHEDLQGSFPAAFNCVKASRIASPRTRRPTSRPLPRSRSTKRNIKLLRNDVADGDGHGTHVCGIITANDNIIGVVGVAPNCKVIPIKVLGDDGHGSFESIINGINLAIDLKVDVINMSLGATNNHPDLYAACKRAYDANIPIICAAGNRGTATLDYPAQYEEVISVGALDVNNLRATFSQMGSGLDFMAPGVEILSTVPVNGYMLMSGTSMAAPWIAGVVALLISRHRQDPTNKTPITTVEDIREHLKRMTVTVEQAGTGFGLVDVTKMREDFITTLSLNDRFKVLQDKVIQLERKLLALGSKV